MNMGPVVGLRPEECGTFTLTADEKLALWEAAKAQQAARRARLPDESSCLRSIFDGHARLKEMGWRDPLYAPRDRSPLDLIEAGSTGIHRGYRDEHGFWIIDDEAWPSQPMLFRTAQSTTPTLTRPANMSYSFNVRANNKADAITAAEKEFDKVVAGQPIHAKDRKAAMTAAENIVNMLHDDPSREISLSVSGYVSWTDGEGEVITQASVNVAATLVTTAQQ